MADPVNDGAPEIVVGGTVSASEIPTVDPREITSGGKGGQNKPPVGIGRIRDTKEESASNIALLITWTFSASAGLILFGLYLVLRRTPADAKVLLEAATPILKEAGSFLSSVFGPLLAFVLGYYFGEKKTKDA
jgi:hypothetical protein